MSVVLKKNPKIFIGVTEVAGYFQNLFLGFIELEYSVGYLNVNTFRFNYDSYRSNNHPVLNFLMDFAKSASEKNNSIINIYYKFCKLLIFIWCLYKYDTFIFGVGSSFFRYRDYYILKLFKKKIVHISLGSDSRPSYLNGSYKDDKKGLIDLFSYFRFKNVEILNNLNYIEKFADVIINYPQIAHFHTRTFIDGNFIGFPTIFSDDRVEHKDANSSVRILHAPTRPLGKGSLILKEVISSLEKKGYNIEYIEITNKTNFEVINEIKKADIVLDELYSDVPLGGLGAEAGYHGVPVVVSGYYANQICKKEYNNIPPSTYCLPDDIQDELEKLIKNKQYRIQKGMELNAFLRDNWGCKLVAQKYLNIINGDIPPEWYFDNTQINYTQGWGLSEKEVKNNIKGMVNRYGKEGLCLSKNPKLEKIFLHFAFGSK